MEVYKILVRDNINQRFIKMLNNDKKVYEKNLNICLKAQEDLKCNIIFNGITKDKQDLKEVL